MNIKKPRILALVLTIAMLVSVMPFTAITASAVAPATYTDITLGTAEHVNVSAGESKYFRFVPSITGTYRYYSSSNSGDTYGYILDESGNELVRDDDGGGNNNFSIEYNLNAGSVYYLQSKMYNNGSGTFYVSVVGVGLPTPPTFVEGPGVYSLFNSGRTGEGNDRVVDYSSRDNGGYDLYTQYPNTIRLGLSFTINTAITERATLTIHAFDVDESSGERDLIYLVDETDGSRTQLSGYLSGRNWEWNTTTMYVDPSCFEVGHSYRFELTESVSGWVVWVRTVSMQIGNTEILEHDFDAEIDQNGNVSTTLFLKTALDTNYILEYAATHGGDQLGSLLNQTMTATTAGATQTANFQLEGGAPAGTYAIDIYIKDSVGNPVATYTVNASYAPTPVNYVAVNYDSNGGNTNVPIDTASYVEGDTITVLFDYIPARAGHTFLGWATDRSATAPEFTLGGANTITAGVDDITFYAVWRNDTANVTIESALDTMIIYPDTGYYQTMEFYVAVSGLDPVDSIAVVPQFDSTVLELVSVEWLVVADIQDIEDDGTLKSVSAWNDPTDINTNVYKITLQAIGTTASTEVTAAVMVQDETNGLRTLSVVGRNISIVSCSHASFTLWISDGTNHLATCDVCGYNELRAHSFDHGCDTDCNDGCGYTRITEHVPGTEWYSDGTNHWHICTVCGVDVEIAVHNPDESDWVTDGTNHWRTCNDCGVIIDSTVMVHTAGTEWYSNGENHWHTCTECGVEVEYAAHIPDVAWVSDGTNHWNVCVDCGTVVDSTVVAHNPNTEWVTDGTNHWRTCNDCGVIIDSTVMVHTAGTEWYSDGENHWHTCTECNTTIDFAAHQYSDGSDPACDDCEYIRVIRGDVDGDLDIDSDDAVLALLHMFYADIYPVNQDLDFNGDGMENSDDATHLLQHVFYPEFYPLADFMS